MNVAVAKDINFLPQRIVLARQKRKQKLIFFVASLVLALIVGLAVWIPFKLEKEYLVKAKALDEKLSALSQATPVYNQLLAKQKEYEQKKQAVEYLESSNFKVIPFLEKISDVMPPGAYISQLNINAEEGVNITFVSPGPVETATIVVGLRSMDVFDSVDIETVPLLGDSKPVQLSLRFKWAKEKPKEDAKKEAKKEPDKGADINAAIKEAERKTKPQ